MLQGYNEFSEQSDAFESVGVGQGLSITQYWDIAKRRAHYFILTFVVVLLAGAFVTAIQRPVYEAKGRILVESQQIPTSLVMPTVTESANQRIQVIQQRIMTRDNLMALVKKYGMFPREQDWMSTTDILDLMRKRTQFELVGTNAGQPGQNTIAFTVSFDYENPDVTLKVTNDLLTLILAEDARSRSTRATETAEFLNRESQRLQGELASIDARIAESQTQPIADASAADPAKLNLAELTKLQEDLAQKRAIYSDAHPEIVALKKRIAAMERLVAQAPTAKAVQASSGLVDLEQRRLGLAKTLEDNNKKLEEARMGQKLETDQQSERLEVIEQPTLPSQSVKPNRMKFLALSFAIAVAAGGAVALAAEMLDQSIRYSHQLTGVAGGRMIVSIPYIATRAETFRRKGRLVVLGGALGAVLLAGVVGFLFFGPPIDLSGFHQFWLDHLTALSK